MKGKILGIIMVLVAIATTFMSTSLFENTDRTRNYVGQTPLSGKYTTWTEGDYEAVGVAEALANSNVQWVPQVMMGGNGNSQTSAMDAVGLKMLLDITKSFDKK